MDGGRDRNNPRRLTPIGRPARPRVELDAAALAPQAIPTRSDEVRVTHGDTGTEVREFAYAGRAHALVRAAGWSELAGTVTVDGQTWAAAAVAAEPGAEAAALWRIDGAPPPGTARIALDTAYSVLSFSVERLTLRPDGLFASPLPNLVERRRARSQPRQRLEAPVWLELSPAPADPAPTAAPTRVRVVEIGESGLRVAGGELPTWLPAGASIEDATLRGGPLDGAPVSGTLRYAGFDPDGGLAAEIVPGSPEAATAWQAAVAQVVHPHTTTRGVAQALSWALFERCGYFNLSGKTLDDFAAVCASHRHVVHRYEDHPDVGVHAAWVDGERVAATLAAARLTRTAWFGLHLAKDPGPIGPHNGPKVLHEVHRRVYDHICAQRDARWIVGVFQRNGSWSSYAHASFPARYRRAGEADAMGVSVWELDATGPSAPMARATPTERASIAAGISRQHTPIFAEAYDLSADELHLESTADLYRRAGLDRRRESFVARVDGVVVAVALAEFTSPGVHVYDLMNAVWLYALAPAGAQHFDALLAAAAAWYGSLGAATFKLFSPLESTFRPARGRRLAEADLTFVSTRILPDLSEHLWEITARPPLARK